jgi:prephenate dehydrogenase
LRETVRMAGSSPEMWADICIANRDALLQALDDYENELEVMRAAIEGADGAELRRLFAQARNAREKWLVGKRR